MEVSSTKSGLLLEKITIVLKGRNIDIKDTSFCCLDGTNSVSGETSGLQRRLCNAAPHSMYVNCRCNWFALWFKHLIKVFPWLSTIDTLLLGLWKMFHYSAKNRSILRELQAAYGMKAIFTVKVIVTWWLSHGAACKRCIERYVVIIEALDNVLTETEKQKPEVESYHATLLQLNKIMQIALLDDVLSTTSALCLLLQSDKKFWGS